MTFRLHEDWLRETLIDRNQEWIKKMDRIRVSLILLAILVAAIFGMTAAVYPQLPGSIPTHWNIHGQVDKYGPRSTVWLIPGLTIPLSALFLGLAYGIGKEPPARFGLLFMGLGTALFFLILQGAILASSLGYKLDMSRCMGVAMGLLFAGLGYGMKDLPRNGFAGIRTPWTMSSDQAWQAAHRGSFRILVVGGLMGSLISLFGFGLIGLGLTIGSMILVVIESYRVTRPGKLKAQ